MEEIETKIQTGWKRERTEQREKEKQKKERKRGRKSQTYRRWSNTC